MNSTQIIHYALNLARLMESVSIWVTEQTAPQQAPRLVRRSIDEMPPAFFNQQPQEATRPIGLGDIGLDDMALGEIIIELSQTRKHFKLWTPYDERFKDALKESIPSGRRRWDADDRCWRIALHWFGNAQQLLDEFFPDLDHSYTDRAYKMAVHLASKAKEEALRQEARRKAREQAARKQREEDEERKQQARKWRDNGRAGKRGKNKERRRRRSHDQYEDDEPASKERSSPYDVLGVRPDADMEVVKAANRVLAKKYHPDRHGSDEMMRKINAAFDQIKRERGW